MTDHEQPSRVEEKPLKGPYLYIYRLLSGDLAPIRDGVILVGTRVIIPGLVALIVYKTWSAINKKKAPDEVQKKS